ncbi:MAG: GGDEF domain-containing protein [Candidatus Saccharimonadales bacterium]|jgi:GGDEF domain-containing protein
MSTIDIESYNDLTPQPPVTSPAETPGSHWVDGQRHNVMLIPREDATVAYKELSRAAAKTVLNHEMLRKKLETDKLTGLPNDLVFQSRLDASIELANSRFEIGEETNVGMLFVDLDQFKPVNTKYGHTFGDKLIQLVATTLTNSLRPHDVVGISEEHNDVNPIGEGAEATRPHGDELKVIIPKITPDNPREEMSREDRMVAIMNRLQSAVDEAIDCIDILKDESPEVQKMLNANLIEDLKSMGFGVSIGAAIYMSGESKEDLTVRADMGMDDNKQKRRKEKGITPSR